MSIYKGTQLISGVATPIAPTKCIGQIVQSAIPLTDAGLHLSDGALINGDGIYGAFVEHISKLDQTLNCFTTEQEWQQSVINYGICGKFVYDANANTVRLPKEYSDTRYLIDTYSSGANWYRVYSDGWCEQGGQAALPNAGPNTITLIKPFIDTKYTVIATSSARIDVACGCADLTTTSFSCGVAHPGSSWLTGACSWEAKGYIDVTTYKSAPLYKYIVVATGTKTDIEIDIDNVVTDLNQKVDKSSMVEVPTIIEVSAPSLMPSWYRVYSDGWCEQGGICGNSADISLLKPYKDTNYIILHSVRNGTTGAGAYHISFGIDNITTNGFHSDIGSQETTAPNQSWLTKGYIK